MKSKIISKIQNQMKPYLNQGQYLKLTKSLLNSLRDIQVLSENNEEKESDNRKELSKVDLFKEALLKYADKNHRSVFNTENLYLNKFDIKKPI